MAEPAPELFDAHLHPESLSDQDLESMALFGVKRALVVSHHLATEPKPKLLRAHFDNLISKQLRRLERAGIRAWAALGIHPLAVPARGLPEVRLGVDAQNPTGAVRLYESVGMSAVRAYDTFDLGTPDAAAMEHATNA